MSSNDLRVVKTLKHIEDVFWEISREKPLRKITVTELCQKAQISKGTFYRYYTDPYDLYSKLMKGHAETFFNSVDYFDLYFKDPHEFMRRFRADSERDMAQHNYPRIESEYEDSFNTYWLQLFIQKILEAAPEEIREKPLTQRQLLELQMILYCDLKSFRVWPDRKEETEEVISSWIDRLFQEI